MRSFREVKRDYDFTDEDEGRLRSLAPLMDEHGDEAARILESWLLETKATSRFFASAEQRTRVFASHRKWFLDLFSGSYDNRYYERLIRIGQIHDRARIEPHYMYRVANILREFCAGILIGRPEKAEEQILLLRSVHKILDMSLDVIVSSYIEEELRSYSATYRVKRRLISLAEGFAQAMNFVLVLVLIAITLGVIGLFMSDVSRLLSGTMEHGIITALGSMIVLWVMIELMNTEIAHLKGGKFHISVFIGVALVAFIRETLIVKLRHEGGETQYPLMAMILILGMVFWLVTKAEKTSG